MLICWREIGKSGVDTQLLDTFAPLLWDWIHFYHEFYEFSVPDTFPTFGESMQCLSKLRQTGTPKEAWENPITSAAHDYLGYLFTISLWWLHHVAAQEEIQGFNRIARVKPLVEYIKAKLADREFQKALEYMQGWLLRQDLDDCASDVKFVRYQIIQLHSVQIVLAILENPSTLSGLQSLGVAEIGLSLIHSLKTQTAAAWPFWNYYEEDYCRLVTLAGLCIPPGSEERTVLFEEAKPVSKCLGDF